MTTNTLENTLQQLAEQGKEVTLQNIKSQRLYIDGWQDWQYELTEKDIEDISNLLGGRYTTRNKVANKLRYLRELPSFWAFDRITFCKHGKRWSYTAGQDYPYELNLIRKFFLSL